MCAVQISIPGGPFELVQREIPVPHANEVLIKVQSCGVCRGESVIKEGLLPGLVYPRIPGHEVIGTIVESGKDTYQWKNGDRVAAGWHGGHCFTCKECMKGNVRACENSQSTGISRDGGYAEFVTARREAPVKEPLQIPSNQLLSGRSIRGFSGGDIADTIDFSLVEKVRSMVEIFPLEDTAKAYDKMMHSELRFRAVLQMYS